LLLREARRFFRRSPLLGLSAIAVLGLGMGTSGLGLTLLLAFSSPSYPGMRTMGYATIAEETEGGGAMRISWQRFDEVRRTSGDSTRLAAYSKPIHTTLQLNGGSRPLAVAAVSSGFFSAFTSPLSTGRDFTPEEEGEAGRHVAILNSSLALSLFGSPGAALNQFLQIDWLPYQVVGVSPPDFEGVFGDSVQVWVPASSVIPLLLPAPSPGLAEADVWKQIASFYGVAASDRSSSIGLVTQMSSSPAFREGNGARLHVSQGLTSDPVRDARLRKWLRLGLLLAVVFMIVSGLNYSLLLLARAPRFAEEVRLKRALGATTARLMADLVAGPAAVVAGSLVAACLLWSSGLIVVSGISESYGGLVRGSRHAGLLALDVQVVAACALTLIIAWVPALALLRESGAPRLGYTSTGGRRMDLLLQIPVTLQVSFCVGTWVLAGMIVTAVLFLMAQPLGYDPGHLTVFSIRPLTGTVNFRVDTTHSFPEASAIGNLLERVRALPGVRAASFASGAPFDQQAGALGLQRTDGDSVATRTATEMIVSADYFRTIGARILRGRDFSRELAGGAQEVVINETLASELWPDESPLNRSVRLADSGVSGIPSHYFSATVVGVVENMRLSSLTESPEPTVFLSLSGFSFFDITPSLLVSGSADLHSVERVAGGEVAQQMPGLGVLEAYSVANRVRASLGREKSRAYFALGGALAMALVAYIGLYAALAYYVASRRRELAVRICLGASPRAMRGIVLARAVRSGTLGAVVSLPLWPVLAQLSSSDYLGRVSWSTERAAFISLACVLVSAFVSLVPAIAASRISASEMLKAE
jgi:putative ABC transport system permease protein